MASRPPASSPVSLAWALDCMTCGKQGDVVLAQDADTGELVDEHGTAAHDFVCNGCGSDDLCPAIVDHPLSAAAVFA